MYKSSIKLYKEDSRRSRTVTPKKCTKKRNARHSELLSLNLRFLLVFFFFHVAVVVFVVVLA